MGIGADRPGPSVTPVARPVWHACGTTFSNAHKSGDGPSATPGGVGRSRSQALEVSRSRSRPGRLRLGSAARNSKALPSSTRCWSAVRVEASAMILGVVTVEESARRARISMRSLHPGRLSGRSSRAASLVARWAGTVRTWYRSWRSWWTASRSVRSWRLAPRRDWWGT